MQNGLIINMHRVGFVFGLDASWQGGINYYKNLFHAVYQLPNREVDIVVFCGYKNAILIENELPALLLVKHAMFDKYALSWWLRKIVQSLCRQDIALWLLVKKYHLNVLSHFNQGQTLLKTPIVAWITDFQHVHLPHFFTKKEISIRNAQFDKIAKKSKLIILSSHAAKSDFIAFSPKNAHKAKVLQFCINPNLMQDSIINLEGLQRKYSFSGDYFFLPNQFWAHKNHEIVLNALSIAVKTNPNLQVICTGNTQDYRQPKYFYSLKQKVLALDLSGNIKILGLVPYQDLIALMQYAIAIINPSYFEGWSTTVEESKLFNKTILLSDIPVHREQAPAKALFFNAADEQELAEYMLNTYENKPEILDENIDLVEASQRFTSFGLAYQRIMLAAINE